MTSAIDYVNNKLTEIGIEVLAPNPELVLPFNHFHWTDENGRNQLVYIIPNAKTKFGFDHVTLIGISYFGPESGLDPEAYLSTTVDVMENGYKGHWSWIRINPEVVIVAYGVEIPITSNIDGETLKELLNEIAAESDRGEQILSGEEDKF